MNTKKVELKFGFTDKKNNKHLEVEFGKRPKVSDLLALDVNPQAQNPTLYVQFLRRLMITKFGTLTMPVPQTALLALDTYDDDLLEKAANEFLQDSRGEKEPKILPNNEAQLMFGIEIEGVNYNIVKFGNRLTVADNVEASSQGLGTGVARTCFQIGKQICEIRNSETGLKIEGQLALENFSDLDSEDFNAMRLAAEFFRLGVSEKKK